MSFNPEQLPYNNPNITRRVALITGGNSGIGFYTALHLYLHGHIVYLAGRNAHKISKAIKELQQEAFRRRSGVLEEELQTRWVGELRMLAVDLLELESVEHAVNKFQTVESQLDLLVLNAGVGALPYAMTKDGFEVQFQTNYVSHFLLTQRLLPMMRQSLSSEKRIIYVSSVAHYFEFTQFNREWTFNHRPNILFTWFRYAMAKNCGMQYMKLLALKNPDILCYSVHPGFVMNTNFFSYWTRIPIIGVFFWMFFQMFGAVFGCSNEEGSYASLKCALSNEVILEENGSYFSTGGKISRAGWVANDLNSATHTYVWTIKQLEKRGFHNLD